jgi:hypothetical protein
VTPPFAYVQLIVWNTNETCSVGGAFVDAGAMTSGEMSSIWLMRPRLNAIV